MLRGGGGGGRKKGKGNRECSRSGRGKKGKARRVKEGRKEGTGERGAGGGKGRKRGGGKREGGRGGKKQQMYNTQHPLRNMVRLLVSVTKNSDGSCLPGRMPNRYSGRPKSMSWRVKNTKSSYQKFVQ